MSAADFEASVLVVGGGIVGLATALELGSLAPKAQITLLEKEAAVGQHQSTHNSGVLHCGLYYKPGSLKARLAVSGVRRMIAFCQEHDLPHEVCGKLVVASDELERQRLTTLFERGTRNGLAGLRLLDPHAMRQREPAANGVQALLVPEEGIVDYAAVIAQMARVAHTRGIRIVTGAHVRSVRRERDRWVARTNRNEFAAHNLVNCAGLHCDRVARMAGAEPGVQIVPFRGEYYKLRAERADLVRHLIYPVPDPVYPFLGVHFTRLMRGGTECGPNAVLATSREGYNRTDVNLRDALQTLSYAGFWRFVFKHRVAAWDEITRSLSKARFCAALQRLVPDVKPEDLEPGGSGVRAQAMTPSGELVQDFQIVQDRHALHVLNAPSPAATASLAIGHHLAQLLTASR